MHTLLWICFSLIFLCFWACSLVSLLFFRRVKRRDLSAITIMQDAREVPDGGEFLALVGELMTVLAANYAFLQEEIAGIDENDRYRECYGYFHYFFLYDIHERSGRFRDSLPVFILMGFVIAVCIALPTFFLIISDSLWDAIRFLFMMGSLYIFGAVAIMSFLHFRKIYKVFPQAMEEIDARLAGLEIKTDPA